jgi:regulator of sigma E protease
MEFLQTVFYFVVTLGTLVFIHELGHFLAAKATGMRVDRFSIGFPPRAFGKKFGETDYCISWIPIGGYVKIAGMIDESFDLEHLEKPPEPWEFRSKPILARMFVLSAGVIMNILLAIAIFWGINYSQGKILRETTEVGYVVDGSPAAVAGLQPGDTIVDINGKRVEKWGDILNFIYLDNLGDDITFTLLRNGTEVEKHLSRSSIPEPNELSFGIVPAQTEIVINSVDSGKPAEEAGLKPLDSIISLNGIAIRFDSRIREIVQTNAGKPIPIEWKHDGTLMSGMITPTADGKIGISYRAQYVGPTKRISYTLVEAFPEGVHDLVTMSVVFAKQLWQLVTGRAAFTQSVGGPIKIAQMATQSAELGAVSYFGFMALLSISLALLNILPFPALDGGHLMFLVYEAVFRREIPVKIRMALQQAGFVLLLAFMAFVVINDIINF